MMANELIMFNQNLSRSGNGQAEDEAKAFAKVVGMLGNITGYSLLIIAIVQILVSLIFFCKTRGIGDINFLPKMMTILANVSAISIATSNIFMYILGITIPNVLKYVLIAMITLPLFINWSLWLRLFRVQAQLKLSNENTEIIIKNMKTPINDPIIKSLSIIYPYVLQLSQSR